MVQTREELLQVVAPQVDQLGQVGRVYQVPASQQLGGGIPSRIQNSKDGLPARSRPTPKPR